MLAVFRRGHWHPGCTGNELSKPMGLMVREEQVPPPHEAGGCMKEFL